MFNHQVANNNIRQLASKASRSLLSELALRVAHIRDRHFEHTLSQLGKDLSAHLIELAHRKHLKPAQS